MGRSNHVPEGVQSWLPLRDGDGAAINFGTCSYDPYKLGDSEFTFSNTYWAGISRYMVLYDKSLLYHPIEFKDSDIDCYGILPVSYLPNLGKDNE